MTDLITNNQEEMRVLAQKVAASCKIGDVIGLKGTLGAGKTFFASCFINSLLKEKTDVTSPTFNLVYSYETEKGLIYHFDLYRIKNIEELYNIGLEDALSSGITIIEWPEIAADFLPKNYREIEIQITENDKRLVKIADL